MKRLTYSTPWFLTAAVAGMVFLSIGGCFEPADTSLVLARVGKRVLTLDALNRQIPAEYRLSISREQLINQVKEWIDAEVLYQEALQSGIDRDPVVHERLERMKRDLLCAEMIKRGTAQQQAPVVDAAAVEAYYQNNRASFIRSGAVARYSAVVVDSLKRAWLIREKISPLTFDEFARTWSVAAVIPVDSTRYVRLNTLDSTLAAAISQTKKGGISAPVAVRGKFYIVYMIDKLPAGTEATLPEVTDEIVDQLSRNTSSSSLESYIASLRSGMEIEYHFERIPAQSALPVPPGLTPIAR